VYVGRNDKGNHALVFRHSRGRDWWLHVRDRPGAHVVLPMANTGSAPSLEQLLVAANIALAASGAKPGEAYDVVYARVADLRPIKSAPGKVLVRDERVLHVRREALEGWTIT
jgi:predicted ribosome quality control (RQC) complex YloA/Tae2 family protein